MLFFLAKNYIYVYSLKYTYVPIKIFSTKRKKYWYLYIPCIHVKKIKIKTPPQVYITYL